MMNNLKAKLKKEGGFTLVEMLIVVAIIAILIAISIPMVSKALEKSRHAVDQANIRDAIGLANIELLTEDAPAADASGKHVKTYYYVVDPNTHQGKLLASDTEPANAIGAECTCTDHVTTKLQVTVDWDNFENLKVNWKTKNDSTPVAGGTVENS